LGLCSAQRYAGREACKVVQESRAARHLLRRDRVQFEHAGSEYVGTSQKSEPEIRRKDADDRPVLAIQLQHATKRVALAREPPLPQRVRDHDHVVATRTILPGAEAAPEHRIRAENAEEVRRNARRGNLLGIALAGKIKRLVAISGNAGKRMRILRDQLEARPSERIASVLTLPVARDGDEKIGISKRERPQ